MGFDPVPILPEVTTVPVPRAGTSMLFADVNTGRISGRDDRGTDAFQDFRRARGEALRHWRSALGGRETIPVNIYMIGDSVMLGAGATTYQRTWFDITRDSLQREYRPGGEGLIPCVSPATNTFPNRWTLAGTPTLTDFGAGWGRRAVFLDSTDDICTVTGVCDRFYIVYTATPTSGTFKVVIDGGAPATQSAASAITMTGRVWDSGPLTLGSHTVAVSPNAASNLMFIEAIVFFATDNVLGVRMFSGGHGGHRAEHYNGDTTEDGTAIGARKNWAMMPFQPKALVLSGAAALSSAGGTTLTWTGTSPALTNADIGEVIFAGTDTLFPRGVRIVSVTSATVCVVNKTVPAGTYTAAMTRSRVTDATTTIGNVNVTSPTMGFTAADLGKTIAPSAQFVAGTIIKRIVSTTAIEVYPVAIASATGTGTIQILNRQAISLRPDLLLIEFGGNDMFAGIPKAEYKANMNAIYSTMEQVAQLDVPTMTGIYNDERPSVTTMVMWSTGYRADANLTVATTSGQPTITRATTGLIRETRFAAADVGKGVTSTAWTGTLTINSVSADGLSAVLSGNATSTNTNVAALMLQRQYRDDMWDDYRQSQFELSVENNWAFINLYNIGGDGGLYDYQQLISSDNLHPNDRGQQWIADELSTMFGGVKKLASIPQGIFNTKGEIIVATAADVASVLGVGANNTVLMADSSTASGLKWALETLGATLFDTKGDLISASANDTPVLLPSSGVLSQVLSVDTAQTSGLKWADQSVAHRTTTATIAATETQIVGFTVPANTLRVGSVFRLKAMGLLTNTTTATTGIIRVRFGTTTLTGNVAAGISVAFGITARTSIPMVIEAMITVLTIGAGGTVLGAAFPSIGNATAPVLSAPVTVAVALDTTAAKIVELTFISGGASTSFLVTSATITQEA